MRRAEYVACMKEMIISTYTNLAKIPEGRRPLSKSRLGWEDNTKMDVKRSRV
jgi:hypothetical protein